MQIEFISRRQLIETTSLPMPEAFYHSIPRRLLIVRQKLNKNSEIRKILTFSMSIPDSFRLKNRFYLFSKHTGLHILCLLTFFNVSIDQVRRNFGKKCMKPWEIGKLKAYRTTHSFRVDPVRPPNPQRPSKIWKQMHEIFEIWKV